MDIFTYISFAVSPVLILLGILILKIKFSLKNLRNIRNAVLLGIVCVTLVIITNFLSDLKFKDSYHSMKRMAFFVFIVIAFSAELMKFIALRLSFYKRKNFEGPVEGIVYSVFIGLGYSLVAVVLFAFGIIGNSDIKEFMLFLYSYPFANIIFGICLGFFVGLSKQRNVALIDNSTGLVLATFLHGLFYFSFQTSDIRLLIITVIGLFLVSATLFKRALVMWDAKD